MLPPDAHHARKYHDDACSKRMNQRRYRRKKNGKGPSGEPDALVRKSDARRGPRYRQFVAEGWPERILAKEVTQKVACDEFDTSAASVSRWMAAYLEDNRPDYQPHEPDEEVKEAVEGGLIAFRKEFFPDRKLPAFQVEWANLLEETIKDRGRTLLLAPQRFGKSQMLIDMCVKLIIEDPDISIGWVSKTADLAETMVGYIRMVLEHDEELIRKALGDHGSFVPPARGGLPWTNGKLTVATRRKIRKSPTVEALGVGGTVVGRDFDIIVIDDMQDRIRATSPSMREKDAEWFFTDLNSRKEEGTALFFICSRQHEDDVPGRIMADHADDWRIRVYQSHDPACTIDERDHDAHQESDCLLWPEVRTHKWLMSQRRANPEHFQRNYQNNPASDDMTYISAADIADRKSDAFLAGENPGGKLVAGIDPASAKPTAATLWAYRDGKRHLVDALMAKPGNAGVRQIIQTFRSTYGCSTFVVETNGYQGQIMQDSEVKEMVRRLNVRLRPHYSSRVNKWDSAAGVVGMLHMIANPEGGVVLPAAGDPKVLDRLEMVYRQWLTFDPDVTGNKHAKDDLVMASWFPQLEMDRFEDHLHNKVVYLEDRTSYGTTSYGSLTHYARAN